MGGIKSEQTRERGLRDAQVTLMQIKSYYEGLIAQYKKVLQTIAGSQSTDFEKEKRWFEQTLKTAQASFKEASDQLERINGTLGFWYPKPKTQTH